MKLSNRLRPKPKLLLPLTAKQNGGYFGTVTDYEMCVCVAPELWGVQCHMWCNFCFVEIKAVRKVANIFFYDKGMGVPFRKHTCFPQTLLAATPPFGQIHTFSKIA